MARKRGPGTVYRFRPAKTKQKIPSAIIAAQKKKHEKNLQVQSRAIFGENSPVIDII
ncbi:MAG: hypothetical protein LBC88_07080 [Spirochaetaceae bacterium]|nr:hypothetical protein [Spirochaetaceae bacterium]